MTVPEFLSTQATERKDILSAIHEIIVTEDKTVTAEVGEMMGKEMILYKTEGIFKYGLASVKNHMSLHMMPIYGSPDLHARYEKLLNKASFQKGCMNFKDPAQMPLDIVRQLLDDCARIDFAAFMQRFKKPAAR